MKSSESKVEQFVDPEYQTAVDNYIQAVIEEEKKNYKPSLEPFSVKAEKIRLQLTDSMKEFYVSYNRGYDLLLQEVESQNIYPDLQIFKPNSSRSDILTNPEKFNQFIEEGGAIYEVLGFSNEALAGFYKAACLLIEKKQYAEARDSFYFLVTIAPEFGQAWLGLGYCYAECRQLEQAKDACYKAIDLLSNVPDAYLTLIRVFLDLHDKDQAFKVCEIGIAYAKEHSKESWSAELTEYLQEAKRQVQLKAA